MKRKQDNKNKNKARPIFGKIAFIISLVTIYPILFSLILKITVGDRENLGHIVGYICLISLTILVFVFSIVALSRRERKRIYSIFAIILSIVEFIALIILFSISSRIAGVGKELINEEALSYDISDYFTVPDSTFIKFGLSNVENIKQYNSDKSRPRLKYSFCITCPVSLKIKLNSLSITNEKDGESIPYILYYKTNIKDKDVHIIDNLPVIFTNEIEKDIPFEIIVESSQSYNVTKTVYINYDIEIGNKHFIKQIRYNKAFCIKWSEITAVKTKK